MPEEPDGRTDKDKTEADSDSVEEDAEPFEDDSKPSAAQQNTPSVKGTVIIQTLSCFTTGVTNVTVFVAAPWLLE